MKTHPLHRSILAILAIGAVLLASGGAAFAVKDKLPKNNGGPTTVPDLGTGEKEPVVSKP